MKTTLEMAKEAGLIGKPVFRDFRDGLERFAELVRADERNRTWTQDHWTEYERSIAAQEREACAKACDDLVVGLLSYFEIDERIQECAAAIRERGNT